MRELIPKEILKIIETGAFEENGGMLVTSLNFFADNCKVAMSLNSGDEEVPKFEEFSLEVILSGLNFINPD